MWHILAKSQTFTFYFNNKLRKGKILCNDFFNVKRFKDKLKHQKAVLQKIHCLAKTPTFCNIFFESESFLLEICINTKTFNSLLLTEYLKVI